MIISKINVDESSSSICFRLDKDEIREKKNYCLQKLNIEMIEYELYRLIGPIVFS